jgi:hypothetical protein
MLGYILIIGAIARLTQIIFRKSPADNLPHRMFFSQNTLDSTVEDIDLDYDDEEEEEEEEDLTTKDGLQQKRCRHKFIFATITLVSGLTSSILSICAGILFMGSNMGWIRYMKYYIQDPSTYINITVAVAFLWSAYVFGLCTIYKNLKALKAIHQYEYLELENNAGSSAEARYFEDWTSAPLQTPQAQAPIISTTIPLTTNTSTVIMMSTNSSPPNHDYPINSPTEILNSPPIPYYQPPPVQQETTTEKAIRPSEYRAKRRSLLVQSPILNNNSRPRSSSNFAGVGGILPDEIINLQKISTTTDRRSWLSSGSSSIDSSAPNSPSFDQQKPFASISSTLPIGLSQKQPVRRNSVGFAVVDGSADYEGRTRSVLHKTKSSGKVD